MIVNQSGFTGMMNPAGVDDNLTSRQLYPFPPIATTGGIVLTPHQMRMAGLGDEGDRVNMLPEIHPLAAILLIAVILWVFGRE
jgi:hypothetical protein